MRTILSGPTFKKCQLTAAPYGKVENTLTQISGSKSQNEVNIYGKAFLPFSFQ